MNTHVRDNLQYLYDNLGGTAVVLQVVGASYATQTSNATTTYADTGLTCNITPADNSNKVLAMFTLNGVYKDATPSAEYIQFLRGATQIGESRNMGDFTGDQMSISVAFIYLDSPASASALTYKAQFKIEGTGTVYVQQASSRSSVVLVEVAA